MATARMASAHAQTNIERMSAYDPPSHSLRHEQRQLYASNHEWKAPLHDRVALRPTSHATTSRSVSPAPTMASTAPSTMDRSSQRNSSWRDSGSSYTDFDDLYDISDDDDSAVVPLKCSNSMRQLLDRTAVRRESLPSLVIPSPTSWPTIQKLKSATSPRSPLVPPKTSLSPAALARLNVMSLRVPTLNSMPSLDGSLTSDEIASLSPTTPDLRPKSPEEDWSAPIQLDPRAMETLQHIALGFESSELGPNIEVPETQVSEMQERGLNIDMAVSQPKDALVQPSSSEPVSAISVPSPGGFMASLDATSQKMWNMLQGTAQPSTTTAECFYDVPWDSHLREQVVEQVIAVDDGTESDGPPTARQDDFKSKPALQPAAPLAEMQQTEYDEEYDKKLSETAASNMSRTSLWLHAQETYLSALKDSNPLNAQEQERRPSVESNASIEARQTPKSTSSPVPSQPSTSSSPPSTTKVNGHTPKKSKSVRFIVSPSTKTPVTAIHIPTASHSRPSCSTDSLFYHAFQHLTSTAAAAGNQAFTHRHVRADALQAQRLHLASVHRAQLLGQYTLPTPAQLKDKKDYLHLPDAPHDPEVQQAREDVARAERERQALSQISLGHWHLEASRMLSSGSLLPKTAWESIAAANRQGRTSRVLDLGGLPTADWGWAVASELSGNGKVYTVVVDSSDSSSSSTTANTVIGEEGQTTSEPTWHIHRGPSNHRALSVATPWSLPFPDASFDVISARSLHALCRTRPVAAESTSNYASQVSTSEAYDQPFASDLGRSTKRSPRMVNGASDSSMPMKKDEYDATLAEIHRILVPGGTLHYTLLNAEVSVSSLPPPGPQQSLPQPRTHLPRSSSIYVSEATTTRTSYLAVPLPSFSSSASTITSHTTPTQQPQLPTPPTPQHPLHALSTKLATSLLTSSYDPSAGTHSRARLEAAHFPALSIRESWLDLPVGASISSASLNAPAGSASTSARTSVNSTIRASDEVADVTEVVGAVAWERWMLASAKGRGVDALGTERELREVAAAMEAARMKGQRCCWRIRVGCAVKSGSESEGLRRREEGEKERQKRRSVEMTWI